MMSKLILTVTLLANLSFVNAQDWDDIEKVIFYGFTNPENVGDTLNQGQNMDIDLMSSYFQSAITSEGYFPKGASIYLVVEFKESEQVILRFIAGGYDVFHVIKSDNEFLEDWYQLDPKHKKEWNELFNSMLD